MVWLNSKWYNFVDFKCNIDYFFNKIDTILYVYTSGTTGLPKPAVIKQSRYYGGSNGFFTSSGLVKDDVVLCALPIYHANGTILGKIIN